MRETIFNAVQNFILGFLHLFYIQVQIFIIVIYEFLNALIIKICCMWFLPFITPAINSSSSLKHCVTSHVFICTRDDNQGCIIMICTARSGLFGGYDQKSSTQTVPKLLAFKLQYAVRHCHGRTITWPKLTVVLVLDFSLQSSQ